MINEPLYNFLKQIAQARRTATYSEVAPLAGLSLHHDDQRARLFDLLGEISRHEHAAGRP